MRFGKADDKEPPVVLGHTLNISGEQDGSISKITPLEDVPRG